MESITLIISSLITSIFIIFMLLTLELNILEQIYSYLILFTVSLIFILKIIRCENYSLLFNTEEYHLFFKRYKNNT